jgi:hypothetical protein
MLKQYTIYIGFLLFYLSGHALFAQSPTATGIGYTGGQKTVIQNGKKVTYAVSGGHVVATPHQELVKDEASLMTGFRYDARYFPVVFDKDLFVSKGYFSEYVQIQWNVRALNSRIKKFKIFRKPLGASGDSLLVAVVSPDTYTWRDPYADKGTLYKYTLFAEGIADRLRTPYVNVIESVGFSTATGTVSGRITYDGGTAVEGVSVLAETSGTFSGKSIHLDGQDAYMVIPHGANDDELALEKGFTYQVWCRFDGTARSVLMSKGPQYELAYQPADGSTTAALTFRVNNATVTLPFQHPVDSFFHVTAVYNPSRQIKLYAHVTERVDSAVAAAGITPAESMDNIHIGRNWIRSEEANYWQGNISEMRLWSRALPYSEVKRDYNRLIAGTEKSLVGYWRLNSGVGERFYDFARKGFTFYENHGYLRRATWSETTPLRTQLAYKGITDGKGNYTIAGFPYETSGSQYSFIPVFGVHTFDPTEQLRFIGDGASIQNGVDFKDVSSFKVTGTVRYNNTKFPVEGVSVLIDGRAAVNKEGQLILTDNMGRFAVDVPIGPHSLRMSKNGHGFAFDGRFPKSNNDGKITTFDFQQPLSGLEFIDTTLVKVAGRVVGGPVQSAKPLGFGRSKNNIGAASIYLTSEKGFDLTLRDSTSTYTEEYFSNKAEFSTKNVKISPDPATGEFVALLPPEKFRVTALTAGSYTFDDSYRVTVDLIQAQAKKELIRDTIKVTVKEKVVPGYPPINTSKYDTIYQVIRQDTVFTVAVDTFRLQKRQDFIYRVKPSISVTNTKGGTTFGDTEFMYDDKLKGVTVPIKLIENEQYTFGHPVFTQRKSYQMMIGLFEEYTNADNGQRDVVPVVDGKLEIVNNLAINTAKTTLELDNKGRAVYSFNGGLPEINADAVEPANSFTKTLSITAISGNQGAIKTVWREDQPFRGYVFGGMPTGNNFVTTGPTHVSMILRDPPGSNSFATLSKGTSTTQNIGFSVSGSTSITEELSLQLGAKIETFAGVGAGKITEVDVKSNTSLGTKVEMNWQTDASVSQTTTTTQTWSTSNSPLYVGALGDLFIGNATNIVYGRSVFIEIQPETACTTCSDQQYQGYRIGVNSGLRVNPEFATSFMFTQNHIEAFLVPNLKSLRNHSLVYTADPGSVKPKDAPIYISKVPVTDPRFGSENTSKEVWGDAATIYPSAGPSYTIKYPDSYKGSRSDTIAYYNNQIKGWEFWLGENERMKAMARLKENISVDGGTVYEKSVETSNEINTSFSFGFSIEETIASELGMSVDDNGFTEKLSLTTSIGVGVNGGVGMNENTNFSYSIADDGDNNYHTIDIKDGRDGFGPVFALKGGVTTCPYEGEYKTKYYQPGQFVLSEASVRGELPQIDIDKAVIANVPENRSAEFTLQLKNNSEAKYDIWYRLVIEEGTNPYGAVLSIDGEPISDGRMFLVKYGTALTKTLQVAKGRRDMMEYKDLKLVFHSLCQFDPTDNLENIADTVSFSVFFQPGCSDIALSMPKNQWVVNTNTRPTNVLDVEIKKYDLNYGNFKQIAFQYKPASTSQWTTDMIFYNPKTVSQADFDKASEPKAWISGAKINYAWDMSSLPDREYDIRAKSICVLGPGYEVETPTEILRGTKDVKRPRLFGSPQPADGILSAGEEIMIQFDEPIEAGLLTPFNFSVVGVLNGYTLNHNTSVNFDGINDYVKVPDGLNLPNSFTVEYWLKRSSLNKESVVFSKGQTPTDAMEIGFTADNKLTVQIAGQKITTQIPITDDGWHHYAVVYNALAKKISAYQDDRYLMENANVATAFSGAGAIALGKSVVNNDRFFEGNLHELRIWNKALQLGQVYAQMSKALSGSEVGLVGYWPMDEAFGNKAIDKARYRHAVLYADWQVLPKGKALALDGVNDYAEINTASTVVISNEMDYTVEMWFKGEASQKNAVLFSSGKGDGTDKYNAPDFSLSIGFNGEGNLFVMSNGQNLTYKPEKGTYLDNNWHHVAITLQRKGNVNMFVDGEPVASKSSEGFGGIAGARMWIGARGYKENTLDVAHDQFFRGAVDELRIWKLNRKHQQILLDRNAKLKGDETGLVAYYPFEAYANEMGIKLLQPTMADQWKNPYGDNGGNAITSGGAAHSDESPNLKDARPVQKVDFDWVVNGDKLIITPAAHMAPVIEKAILEITLADVEDKFENRLASPASWTAFVDRNQLKWSEDRLEIVKKLYEPHTKTIEVLNLGGTAQKFSIKNLPPWLTATPSSGILEPKTKLQVKLKVNEALNTGYYSEDIYLAGDFGFDEKLNLKLSVLTTSPDWKVNPADYQYSMNLIGQLKVNEIISTDENDKVAAFVNGECRGVAHLRYIEQFDMYQVYLDIYSNVVTGDKIELRVWDASAGTEHRNVKPNYTFEANYLHGTPSSPEMIEAGTAFVQNLYLEKGWNWISFNVTDDVLSKVNNTMAGLSPKTGDQIKGQSVVDVFASGFGWSGSISNTGGLEVGKMYMMRLSNAGKLELSGRQINPSFGINIKAGWNWIGVVPRFNMLVNEALANLPATNGDVIKGKRAFATYHDGMGWIGSLQYMVPGDGYLFKSATNATLVYPEVSTLQSGRITGLVAEELKAWPVNATAFPHNMTIIARLENAPDEDFVVGAFAGAECRGYAWPVSLEKDNTLYFITIQGEAAEDLKLKAYRVSDRTTHELVQQVPFFANASAGSVPQPMLLSFRQRPCQERTADRAVAYPNPFSQKITLELSNTRSSYAVKVTDLSGREVKRLEVEKSNENVQAQWDGTNQLGLKVSPGIYLMHVTAEDYSKVIKVVKK